MNNLDFTRESEARENYQQLFSLLGRGFCIVHLDGTIAYANEEYVRLTGRKNVADILGKSILDWTASYDLERNAKEFQKCIQSGSTIDLEIDYITPSDQTIPVEIAARVAKYNGIDSVYALLKDLSERRLEEKIKKQEAAFNQLILEITQLISDEKSVESALTNAMRSIAIYGHWDFAQIYNVSEYGDKLLASSHRFIGQDHKYLKLAKMSGKYTFKKSEGIPGRVWVSGSPLWVNDIYAESSCLRTSLFKELNIKAGLAFPIKVKNNVVAIVEFLREKELSEEQNLVEFAHKIGDLLSRLVERKKAELLISSQLEFRQSLIKSMRDGFASIHPDGHQLEVNPAFCQMTGFSEEELVDAKPPYLYWPSEEVDKIKNAFDRVLSGESNEDFELIFLRKNGERFPVMVSPSKVANKMGEVVCYMATIKDVTDEVKLREKLSEATLAAKSASRLKSIFLSNMSHEIRTPLGVIMGFSELLLHENLDETQKKIFVETINSNGKLLLNTINDILDISRVEIGKLKVQIKPTELSEIIKNLKNTFEIKCKDKGIELIFCMANNLPREIPTDSFRLKQILNNVVGNAVKFTSEGQITIKVGRANKKLGREYLEFVVEDTGLGIQQDQICNLFELFSQSHQREIQPNQGSGLGLCLSKRLASLLGGDLVLTNSKVGVGSVFTITLPFDGNSKFLEENKSNRKIGAKDREQNKSLEGVKVLLVEDNEDNQTLIKHILIQAGASVEIACNGVQAIELIHSHSDDVVVLMDLNMPVMNGYKTVEKLREEGYQGRIIALTAYALATEVERCKSVGFDSHVSKPIDVDELIATIKSQ